MSIWASLPIEIWDQAVVYIGGPKSKDAEGILSVNKKLHRGLGVGLRETRPVPVKMSKAASSYATLAPELSNVILDSMTLSATASNRVYSAKTNNLKDVNTKTKLKSVTTIDGKVKTVTKATPHELRALLAKLRPLPRQIAAVHSIAHRNSPSRPEVCNLLVAIKEEYDRVKRDRTDPDPMRIRIKYGGSQGGALLHALVPPSDWKGTNLEYVKSVAEEESLAEGLSKRDKRWLETLDKLITFIIAKGRDPRIKSEQDAEKKLAQWVKEQRLRFKNLMDGKKTYIMSSEQLAFLTAIDFQFGGKRWKELAKFVRRFSIAMADANGDGESLLLGCPEDPWVTTRLQEILMNNRRTNTKSYSDAYKKVLEDAGVNFEWKLSEAKKQKYNEDMVKMYGKYAAEQKKNGMTDVYVMHPRACVGDYKSLAPLGRFTWNLMKRVQAVEFERFEEYFTEKELAELKEKKRKGEIEPLSKQERKSKEALEKMGFKFYPEKARKDELRIEWRRAAYQAKHFIPMIKERWNDEEKVQRLIQVVNTMSIADVYDKALPPGKQRPDTIFDWSYNVEPTDKSLPAPPPSKAGLDEETDEKGHNPYSKRRQRRWESMMAKRVKKRRYKSFYILRVNSGFRRMPMRVQELKIAEIKAEIFLNPQPGLHYIAVDFFEENKHVKASLARKIPEGMDASCVWEDEDKRPIYNTVRLVYSGIPREMF